MSLKPITVYNHAKGPNPKKIVIILEELGTPYNLIDIADPKDPSFLKINPNGRLPAIVDPNHDELVLWESGAIAEYLVETYDKGNKLNLSGFADKWHMKQLLLFQASGQGPYYGQGVWFHKYHPEQIESAKDRYKEQIARVWSVLEVLLEKRTYLLGDKLTYIDLCFLPWEWAVHVTLKAELEEYDVPKHYPNYWKWYQSLLDRPSAKKAFGI